MRFVLKKNVYLVSKDFFLILKENVKMENNVMIHVVTFAIKQALFVLDVKKIFL